MSPDQGESGSESDPPGPDALREWVQRQADEYGVDVDDLLIQSTRRDPMYRGTEADHAKAEWFAELWQAAVAGREEDRIHVRGVHYFIVMQDLDVAPPTSCSWSRYGNTEQCYNYLEEAAVLARILGYIPLDGIIDRKADQRVVTEYQPHRRTPDRESLEVPTGMASPSIPDPDARARLRFDPDSESFAEWTADRLAERLVEDLYFDQPTQAPFHIEVWSEKTLPEYIHGVCREMGVNVVVEGEGDLSLTVAHRLVERVEDAGKPAVILYLSDFDPKGDAMAANMAGKLAWLKHRGDLTQRVSIEQLAVTREQIQRLDLPRKPIADSQHTGTGGKAYNTLKDDFEQRKGAGATELNALEQRPEVFKAILRRGIEPFVDDTLGEKNRDARGEWMEELRETIEDAIQGSDVEELRDDLEAWLREFNEHYREARDVLEELRSLKDEGAYREWRDTTREAIEAASFPAATVPDGEGRFPEDPLYDSQRTYPENKARIDRHRHDDGA